MGYSYSQLFLVGRSLLQAQLELRPEQRAVPRDRRATAARQ